MDYFRQRQDTRRNQPRPQGRVAKFVFRAISVVFYCILNNAAIDDSDDASIEDINEPSVTSIDIDNSQSETQVFHNTSNHEPRHSTLSDKQMFPPTSSTPDDSLSAGKRDGASTMEKLDTGTKSGKKKKWFSWPWSKKGSKKKRNGKKRAGIHKSHDTKSVSVEVTSDLPRVASSSSFKILQLTASPGGARKFLHRTRDGVPKVTQPNCANTPSWWFPPATEPKAPQVKPLTVQKSSRERLTFEDKLSVNDFRSVASKESISYASISSLTTSNSSARDDEETGSIWTAISELSFGEASSDWLSTSGSSVTSFAEKLEDDAKNAEIQTVLSPRTSVSSLAKNLDAAHAKIEPVKMSVSSCDCAPKSVVKDEAKVAANKVVKEFSTNRFGVVPGGTIPDVYALIRRTLNLGVPKPPGTAEISLSSTMDNTVQRAACGVDHVQSSAGSNGTAETSPSSTKDNTVQSTACDVDHIQLSVGSNGTSQDESEVDESLGPVPEHKTPSLHRLHTQWPGEDHVSIEVYLGLKQPKTPRQALALQLWYAMVTEAPQVSREQVVKTADVGSDIAVDSGIGSGGELNSTQATNESS